MKPIIRREFIDERWTAVDLDDVAEFWLHLFESVSGESGFPKVPNQSLEIRLTGFPRSAGPVFAKELERRIAGTDLAEARVSLPDSDTLILTSPHSKADVAPPHGLGLAILAEMCEGLIVELRFKLSGRAGRIIRFIKFASTLVIHGELRGGEFLVKALWRTGPAGWEDEAFRREELLYEVALRNGFRQFRATGKAPSRKLARKCFFTGDKDWVAARLRTAMACPMDRPRLAGLTLRFAAFGCGFAAAAWLLQRLIDADHWGMIAVLLLWLVVPILLAVSFFLRESGLLLYGYRHHRHVYDQHFEEHRLVPIEFPEATDDPRLRKLTADLRDANFTHLGDMTLLRRGEVGAVYRVFAAPDGVTAFILVAVPHADSAPDFRFRYWPMLVGFEAQTCFADGGRVESTSAPFTYWRARPGPGTLLRSLAGIDDPLEFLRDHAATTAAFAEERDAPSRIERFEDFVRRQERIHDEERRQYLERPYGWADHIRWYLQLPRKELRG